MTGFAHIGVLQKFYENDKIDGLNLLSRIDTFVGSSIGAVVSCLFAIGMTPLQIYNAFVEIDEQTVLKYSNVDLFFHSFGIDNGEYFMAHMVDIFIDMKVSPKITFSQFFTKFHKRIIFTGSNISKHSTEYFGPDTTGDMRVLDAIRISISIPFLFSAIEYNGNLYCDGGVTNNFPLQYTMKDFQSRHPMEDSSFGVLGCNIESLPPKQILSIDDYIYNIFACSVKKDRQELSFHENTIIISIQNTGSTDFSADTEKRKEMFDIGFAAADKYLLDLLKRQKDKIKKSRRRSC